MHSPVSTARRWAENRAVGDALAAGVVVAVVIAHDLIDPPVDHLGWALAIDVALCLPLLVRRRWPWASFLAIAAVAFGQWLLGVLAAGDVAVLIALYTVGAHARARWMLAASAAVAQLGVVLAVVRWAPAGHAISGGVLMTGTVSAAWITGVYARMRRDYVASVVARAATAERERERDQQALLATAAERARISREMHDIVAHSLSVVIALSDGAAASVHRDPDAAQDAARKAAALGRQSLGEARRLLGALHQSTDDDRVPAPGLAQLDDLADSVRAAGLAVDLTIEGRPLVVPPAAQLTVYRMVQEALTNVLKHAPGARLATVRLRYGLSDIGVEVINDGDMEVPPAGHGRGLSGMRERAAIFEGAVDASPRPQGGWRVASPLHLDEATVVS